MDINYEEIKGTRVLLYSGGLDSWLIDKLWKPDVKLYIDMNTEYSKQEMQNLPKDVIIENLDLGKWERKDAIIPLRNLYLIMLATNYGDVICTGSLAGDRSLDKSFTFYDKTEDMINYLYSPQWWIPEGRKIEIERKFKYLTKAELLQMYLDQGGSLEKAWKESFSCYHPIGMEPCKDCKPCERKFITFAEFEYVDKSWIPFILPAIERDMIPQIKAGTYGRGEKEEKVILNIYNKYKSFIL
jgi:7-cyano-7-deazaguanine synthase in queuosine biosynthesis